MTGSRLARATCGLTLILLGCGSVTPSVPVPAGSTRLETASAASAMPARETAATPTAESTPAASLTGIDLRTVVFGSLERPADLQHDYGVVGSETRTLVIISGLDAEFLQLPGFVGGRAEFFSGESGALLSLAHVYEDGAAARLANSRYQLELSSAAGYGFGAAEPAGFEAEGICDTGPNPSLNGLVETICIWRNGPLVLMVGGPLREDVIRTLGIEMNERASRALGE